MKRSTMKTPEVVPDFVAKKTSKLDVEQIEKRLKLKTADMAFLRENPDEEPPVMTRRKFRKSKFLMQVSQSNTESFQETVRQIVHAQRISTDKILDKVKN